MVIICQDVHDPFSLHDVLWGQYAILLQHPRRSLRIALIVILFGIRRVVLGENTTFVGKFHHHSRTSQLTPRRPLA